MRVHLAIDGGGTQTRAGVYASDRRLLAEGATGTSNPILVGVDQCIATLTALARGLLAGVSGELDTVAGAISGARGSGMGEIIAQELCSQLGARRALISDDLRPVVFANAGTSHALLVIAGTGSSVVAQSPDGRSVQIGGRGTVFGDFGSAYQIGVSALRAAADAIDGLGPATRLVHLLPEAAGVDAFERLVPWTASASKSAIADLAKAADSAAGVGDAVAIRCIEEQAALLARQTVAAADSVGAPDSAPVFLSGGLFESSGRFLAAYKTAVLGSRMSSMPYIAPLRGHRAVLELALADPPPATVMAKIGYPQPSGRLRPTERGNDGVAPLDTLTAAEIVAVMNKEDASVSQVVAREAGTIASVIDDVARALESGGRLIYLGAGTSGRLGVLDASECPPTFGVAADRVVGLIAGGDVALRKSAEGKEDDRFQAVADLAGLQPALGPSDVLVGIAASGTTPYVLSGLEEARRSGAWGVLVCCNPACRGAADKVIALDTGPEVLPGSTRLKAGTATKLVLNMITTGAMARAGFVFEGMMVGMRPTNDKLRLRAERIVAALTGLSEGEAGELLLSAGDSIAVAVLVARKRVAFDQARRLLERAGGNLRRALEET